MVATGISWCDETINPIVGCSKASSGCSACYAEGMARRLAAMGKEGYSEVVTDGKWNGRTAFVSSALGKPYGWRKPRSIFIGSMGDCFHDSVPFAWLDRVLGMVASNPQHTFIMLTKRAQRMQEYFSTTVMRGQLACTYQLSAGINPETCQHDCWPLPNLVLGVSVENQQAAYDRMPALFATPAAKRFVSLEPMVGPVSLRWMCAFPESAPHTAQQLSGPTNHLDGLRRLSGVILGAESGSLKARPLNAEWVRTVRSECREAGVPFMFKQGDRLWPTVEGFPVFDGSIHTALAWPVRE